MNATFFALAFTAALYPKLLAVDLLLLGNRKPRAMFLCLLFGGLTVGITIGLLDVLVFHIDVLSSQKKASAGVDLALGLFLLALGALVATGRLHARRKEPVTAGTGQPAKPEKEKKEKRDWAQLLAEPRFGLAVVIGAVCGIPGVTYLLALHNLVAGHYSTLTRVVGVVVFIVIEFLMVIIPFAFLMVWPEGTKAAIMRFQKWLLGHARQLIVSIALILGAYLTITAAIKLA